MRTKLRKPLTLAVTAVLLLASLFVFQKVEAERYTSIYTTTGNIAGSWHDEALQSLIYNYQVYPGVWGGDTGTWFYTSTSDLPHSFNPSNDRTVTINMYGYNEDTQTTTFVRQYIGYFSADDSIGLNRPVAYTNPVTSSSLIEDEGVLNLYISFKVGTHPLDTAQGVPEGIMRYRFWTWD